MLSTARDLAAFSRALAGDRLLTGSWRERMFTPRVTPAGDTLPYALGWFVQRLRTETDATAQRHLVLALRLHGGPDAENALLDFASRSDVPLALREEILR